MLVWRNVLQWFCGRGRLSHGRELNEFIEPEVASYTNGDGTSPRSSVAHFASRFNASSGPGNHSPSLSNVKRGRCVSDAEEVSTTLFPAAPVLMTPPPSAAKSKKEIATSPVSISLDFCPSPQQGEMEHQNQQAEEESEATNSTYEEVEKHCAVLADLNENWSIRVKAMQVSWLCACHAMLETNLASSNRRAVLHSFAKRQTSTRR
eukprot:1939922-Rhodomonas_salina.1